MTEHRKGLYFSNIYENGRQFLCGEINEDALVIDKKFNEDRIEWWQQKAVKRYNGLYEDDKLNSDTLWYDSLDTNTLKSWLSSRGIEELI
jgi:hypothetical protein